MFTPLAVCQTFEMPSGEVFQTKTVLDSNGLESDGFSGRGEVRKRPNILKDSRRILSKDSLLIG